MQVVCSTVYLRLLLTVSIYKTYKDTDNSRWFCVLGIDWPQSATLVMEQRQATCVLWNLDSQKVFKRWCVEAKNKTTLPIACLFICCAFFWPPEGDVWSSRRCPWKFAAPWLDIKSCCLLWPSLVNWIFIHTQKLSSFKWIRSFLCVTWWRKSVRIKWDRFYFHDRKTSSMPETQSTMCYWGM